MICRLPCLLPPCLRSHLVRAGMLHTIQARLAGDALDRAGGVGGTGASRRHRGAHTRGGKYVPLLERAREPTVEERIERLEAARAAAAADSGAAECDGGAAEREERPRQLAAV